MKHLLHLKQSLVLFCLLSLLNVGAQAQLDSLLTYVSEFDSTGFAWFYPDSLKVGKPYELYQLEVTDGLHKLELTKEWTDPQLGMQHYRYQQTFKKLEVEAAGYSEHAKNGFLVFANGKVAEFDTSRSVTPVISEQEAFAIAMGTFEANQEFAWMNKDFENELRGNTGDPLATHYPVGELMWGLDNYNSLRWKIPESRYRLAWRFEIYALPQDQYVISSMKAFYVDAMTGEIFREEQLRGFRTTSFAKPVLFPNPATTEVKLVFPHARPRKIQLVTMNGSLIDDLGETNSQRLVIDTSTLQDGIYLLRIQQGALVYTAKFIKK